MALEAVAIVLAVLAIEHALLAHGSYRVAARLDAIASKLQTIAEHEPGTDPSLIERLESAERRISTVHDDVVRVHRKTAQERRRIEEAAGVVGQDLDDDEREAAQLALAITAGANRAPAPPQGRQGGLPRLIKRR